MRARLSEYAAYHQSRGNELCHYVGVPLIVFGAGGMFGAVSLTAAPFPFTLTELVLLLVAVFYVVEARSLGVLTALTIVGLGELGRLLPAVVGLVAFLFGWAVQFVGHARFEHRSPAFIRNLVHLLVGPAWLVERLFKSEK